MVYGCASKTVKCLVFFFNFLAVVCGLALVTAGAVGLISGSFYTKILTDIHDSTVSSFRIVLFIAIGLGCVLAVLGFLGCCGAWCENQCLLGSFVTCMILMLLAQFLVGVLVLVYRARIKEEAKANLVKSVEYLKQGEPDSVKSEKDLKIQNATCAMWRLMQNNLQCCGTEGITVEEVSRVCESECGGSFGDELQRVGCPDALVHFFEKYGAIIGGVVLGFVVLELIAVIFGCCLCCEIRKASDTY